MFSKVVDLLVSMCRSALESPRKVVIFEPYPSVVDPNDPQMLAFNPRVSGQPEPTMSKAPVNLDGDFSLMALFPLNVCLVKCIYGCFKVIACVLRFYNLIRVEGTLVKGQLPLFSLITSTFFPCCYLPFPSEVNKS